MRHLHSLLRTMVVMSLTFIVTVAAGQASAQDPLPLDPAAFSLFGEVDTSAPEQLSRRPFSRRDASDDQGLEPEFTLVGTSRIGDRYTVLLRNRDGSEVAVRTHPDENTPIAGYSGYSVAVEAAGRVAVHFPVDNSCVEFHDQGVSCNGPADTASLQLTRAEPLQPSLAPDPQDGSTASDFTQIISATGAARAVSAESSDIPPNPFTTLRARGFRGDGAGSGNTSRRGFEPRRIEPADIPPGMRVVSTPFGDRLVTE